MRRRCLSLMLGIGLVGCASGPNVVGEWVVDPAMLSQPPKGVKPEFMQEFARGFAFEFNSDGTFRSPSGEGIYRTKEDQIGIVVTKVMGEDLTSPLPPTMGKLSPDGQTLTVTLVPGDNLPPGLSEIRMVRHKK